MVDLFKNIGIVGTHPNHNLSQTLQTLYQLLSKDYTLFFEQKSASLLNIGNYVNMRKLAEKSDAIIVIGGDGSFLSVAREISEFCNTPIIGINRGNLGFLTEILPGQLDEQLLPILEGHFKKEKRYFLECSINGENIKHKALNDIVIASGEKICLFEMKVFIDDEYAFHQRADGLIVATSTGSTAHALSAGGPIIHPNIDAVALVPMFSHSLNARPIVVNATSKVKIRISNYNQPKPVVLADGNNVFTLKESDEITIKKSSSYVHILHSLNYDYFDSLRAKLHWSKLLY